MTRIRAAALTAASALLTLAVTIPAGAAVTSCSSVPGCGTLDIIYGSGAGFSAAASNDGTRAEIKTTSSSNTSEDWVQHQVGTPPNVYTEFESAPGGTGSGRCMTAGAETARALITLRPCSKTDTLQWWNYNGSGVWFLDETGNGTVPALAMADPKGSSVPYTQMQVRTFYVGQGNEQIWFS